MGVWLQAGAGGALMLAGWLLPRQVAAARTAAGPAVLLDLLPVGLASTVLLAATGRPILSGLVVLALGAGLALADRTKREVLREPVVFSDVSELPHVVTHPHLYLPFAGPGLVVGGAVAGIAGCAALVWLEPRLLAPDRAPTLACGLIVGAVGWVVSREPVLSAVAAMLRRLDPVGEPVEDMARLGPFAVLLVYGIIARAERTERRARYAPLPAPFLGPPAGAAVPVVLVQCESFFDARRLSPAIPKNMLPGLERCRKHAVSFGRLDVSGWGANTMRAEFAALTGIPEGDLGYDRFNPYHALARAPIASLARDLRGHGYQTLCLHPFDRGFFRRDEIMPKLGFDEFLCRQSLGGSRRPPYFSDPDLGRLILEVIDSRGPRVFVFAITMGNHGPWWLKGPAIDAGLARQFDPSGVPQGGDLLRYLDGLRRSDEMLDILVEGMERRGRDGILAFYGDHLPSLPRAFEHFGFEESTSDYVLWPGPAKPPRQLDLPAHRLPQLIKDALRVRYALDPSVPAETACLDGAA
jgi:hypothetical protein